MICISAFRIYMGCKVLTVLLDDWARFDNAGLLVINTRQILFLSNIYSCIGVSTSAMHSGRFHNFQYPPFFSRQGFSLTICCSVPASYLGGGTGGSRRNLSSFYWSPMCRTNFDHWVCKGFNKEPF